MACKKSVKGMQIHLLNRPDTWHPIRSSVSQASDKSVFKFVDAMHRIHIKPGAESKNKLKKKNKQHLLHMAILASMWKTFISPFNQN